MSVKKLSELDEISSLTNTDLMETSQDNLDTTYTSKKITFANVTSSILTTNIKTSTLGISINNPSSITTGLKGYIIAPFNAEITQWNIVATSSGNIQFDIWKANNSIPTIANTITASNKPTLSSQQLITGNVNSWTTTITNGDVIAFNVDSASSLTGVTLTLGLIKT